MKYWNEDNFLERLMPQQQTNDRAQKDFCPDTESLCAFSENRTRGVVRDAIASHLAECKSCAELHKRLLNFAAPPQPTDEGEWRVVEKRLENWMDITLRAQARLTRPDAQPANILPGSGERGGWSWWYSWKVQWALGTVATLGVLATATILFTLGQPYNHGARTAVRVTQPAASATTQSAPPATLPPSQPANPGPVGDLDSNIESEKQGKSQARVGEKQSPAPADNKSPSESANLGQSPEIATPVQTPITTSEPSFEKGISTSETAQAENPASPNPEIGMWDGPRPSSMSPANGKAVNGSPIPKGPTYPRNVTLGRPGNGPPIFRLEAGTRLWVKLNSLHRQPDGSLGFRGTLFEPITASGGLMLDRGTEVAGIENLSQGQTSLLVTDFIVQGLRYTLQGTSGAKNAPTLGAGRAVEFDAGQVVETFSATTLTYVKAPESIGRAQPAR